MGLRVAREKCELHPDQDATANCGFCGKSICRECIALFGYYCSENCRTQNQQNVATAKAGKSAASMAEYKRGMNAFRYVALAIVALIVIAVGFGMYRLLLDPAGKKAWEWGGGLEANPVLIGAADGNFHVVAGDKLYALKLRNGRVVAAGDAGRLSGLDSLQFAGDSIVGVSSMRICRAGMDGTNQVHLELDAVPEGLPIVSGDGARAYYVSRKRRRRDDAGTGFRMQLHTLDLVTGKELGVETISSRPERVTLLGGRDDDVVIYAGRESTDQAAAKDKRRRIFGRQYDWTLELVNCKTGKVRRRTSLSRRPEETPQYAGGWVSFIVKDTLYAVNLFARKQRKFKIKVGEYSVPEHLLCDEEIFVLYNAGMVCLDLATGKETWKVPLGADPDDMVVLDDRIVLIGARSESKDFDVSKMPGFNQAPDVVKDFGIGKGAKIERAVPVLAAIRRENGKPLWQVENVRGNLLADDDRVALIADVAQTSNIGFFKEGAELYVRQFDPDSGKKLYERTTKGLAVENLRLCGNRAVGTRIRKDGKTTIVAIRLR